MKVEQKYVVGREIFDTLEAAEEYLEVHQDQSRIDAYTDFLRDKGAQRISRTITDHLMDFIKFEKGTLTVDPTKKIQETEEVPEVAEEEIENEAPEVKEEAVAEPEQEAVNEPKPSLFAQNDVEAESEDPDGAEEVPEVPPEVMAATESKPKGKSLFS